MADRGQNFRRALCAMGIEVAKLGYGYFSTLVSHESQKNKCTTVSSGRWGMRGDFGRLACS